MRLFHLIQVLFIMFILLFPDNLCVAQSFERPRTHKRVNGISKRPSGRKQEYQIKEPRSATKAIRKQKAEEKKRDKEYKAQLKADRKRHLEIQSPEVRERILQNRKNSDINYKAKKKAIGSNNKKAARKYR